VVVAAGAARGKSDPGVVRGKGTAVDELLEVSTQTMDGTAVLAVAGELDLSTVPILLGAVDKALGGGAACVTIDAAEITFADSGALQGLLRAQQTAADRGAQFRLVNAVGQLEQVLSISGVDQLLDGPGRVD
jgi:anti-anti-sigma factor